MELKDTVELMLSDDYRDRLRAEYWQTKYRYEKARKLVVKIAAGTAQADTDAEAKAFSALIAQVKAMRKYLNALEIRAAIDDIELN